MHCCSARASRRVLVAIVPKAMKEGVHCRPSLHLSTEVAVPVKSRLGIVCTGGIWTGVLKGLGLCSLHGTSAGSQAICALVLL
eukprot:6793267-Prorocentrum_lima.AAC.1